MNRKELILLLGISLAAAAGCTTESYCFEDCDGDGTAGTGAGGTAGSGGTGESGTGGTGGGWGGTTLTGGSGGEEHDACVITNNGIEICDGIDNNCNGEIDEGFDLSADPRHCGTCETNCTTMVQGAVQATCTATPGTPGECGYTECASDWHDLNGDPSDGCEYYCVKRSDTDLTCDNIDDNCNGLVDDGIDFCTDANNCGKCGRNCQGRAHAIGQCVKIGNPTTCDESNTRCEIASCEPGWIDANGIFEDGCEYACVKTKRLDPMDPSSLVECAPGEVCDIEYCDGIDNDCDGKIDGMDPDLMDPVKGDPLLNQACFGGTYGECAKPYHQGLTRCAGAEIRCLGDNTGTVACTNDSQCTDPNKPYCVDSPNPPGKVCGTKVVRVNDLPEICDGLDNNCDNQIDVNPTDAGGKCGSNIGLCTQGTFVCQNASLVCSGAITPTVEVCNGADNNCDGVIDGTTTPIPVACQTDADCQALPTAKFCLPRSGPADKVCAALATDIVDATNNPLPCQVPLPPPAGWTSACQAGTLACVGGAKICQGAITATATHDTCGVDANCDGLKSPDFDLDTDVRNCGTCGNDCTLQGGHVNWICQGGTCTWDPANKCMYGFIDCDTNPNDCERPCIKLSNQEICSGIDDNCDCNVDELQADGYPNGIVTPSVTQVCGIGVAATGICLTGTTVSCVQGEWACTYPLNHCDGGGPNCHLNNPPTCCSATPDICDGLDNNCNGNTDENFKPPIMNQYYLGQECASDDNIMPKHGLCQQTGTYQCAGPNDTSCQNSSGITIAGVKVPCGEGPGQSGYPCEELCDGLDNDCDGLVDESVIANVGDDYWVKPDVVRLGGLNVWMFQYEAARPTATNTTPGMGNGWWRGSNMLTNQPVPPGGTTMDKTPACSVPDRVPWFNISGPEAQHVCVEMGGRLCRNSEWQMACRAAPGNCRWSFVNSCTTFNSTTWATCNLSFYDFDPNTAGTQDGLLPTGFLNNCRAVWGSSGYYDMTGNLREITCPPGTGNPLCTATTSNFTLMGGAFNTADPTGEGAACDFTFYNVSDTFKLFDVGFRCCFDFDPTI